jgi:CPA2 family monovalent cation:H+ antiporter-2
MPELDFLVDVLIFLAAAVVAAPIFHRLRSSLVLGYLVAGIAIGPHGFALIEDSETTRGLAELGVVFLLFTVGLELSIERLRVIRSYILGLGTTQVAVSGVAITTAAVLAGVEMEAAIVIGAALALSSTAVVLQLLSERGEMASRVGRISIAILLLQDLAVVPFLALAPSLADSEASLILSVPWTMLQAALVVAAMVVVGRLVLRPLLRTIAVGRGPELFAAVTLLILLGMSWATSRLGLSSAIGGFLAGLLLAETEYRHQVAADIAPFRGLLLGLFFMTVGMGLDIGLAVANLGLVVALAVSLVVSKAAVTTGLCRIGGQRWGPSIHVGLLLAQGGEFGFIMLTLAISAGILAPGIGDILIAMVALTMAATPALGALGAHVDRRLGPRAAQRVEDVAEDVHDLKDHVIIAGFGRVGQSVGKTLAAADIPYVAVEAEPTRVAEARAQGLPVFFGDATRTDMLVALGAGRARAAVVILDNAEAAERAVHQLHRHHPALHIFVRARDNRHRRRLEAAGATGIVHETYEMSLQLGGNVLRRLGTAEDKVTEIIQDHRAEDYARLSDVILPVVAQGGEKDAEGTEAPGNEADKPDD